MYNPEAWMGMGMGMYPYPPFFPAGPMARPEFFQNPMSFRGYRGAPRGRFQRGRGRGNPFRGRGGNYQNSYENDQYYNKHEEYESHDHRRSKYSRSR